MATLPEVARSDRAGQILEPGRRRVLDQGRELLHLLLGCQVGIVAGSTISAANLATLHFFVGRQEKEGSQAGHPTPLSDLTCLLISGDLQLEKHDRYPCALGHAGQKATPGDQREVHQLQLHVRQGEGPETETDCRAWSAAARRNTEPGREPRDQSVFDACRNPGRGRDTEPFGERLVVVADDGELGKQLVRSTHPQHGRNRAGEALTADGLVEARLALLVGRISEGIREVLVLLFQQIRQNKY